MSADEFRDEAQLDDIAGLPDEKVKLYRDYLRQSALVQGFASRPFDGLSWDYFLADVELEARAARITVPRDGTVGSVCDTIDLLPPTALVRLMAALSVYFTPWAPENEAQVDYLLRPLDAATAKRDHRSRGSSTFRWGWSSMRSRMNSTKLWLQAGQRRSPGVASTARTPHPGQDHTPPIPWGRPP